MHTSNNKIINYTVQFIKYKTPPQQRAGYPTSLIISCKLAGCYVNLSCFFICFINGIICYKRKSMDVCMAWVMRLLQLDQLLIACRWSSWITGSIWLDLEIIIQKWANEINEDASWHMDLMSATSISC
jgi:hypothetical protein